MRLPFPEPTSPRDSRSEVFLGYLEYFRSCVIDRVGSLSDVDRRRSLLPSGWTPIQVLKHLTYVEMRWLEWGFSGRPIDEPWGDERDGRWHVGPEESYSELAAALAERAARTQLVVAEHDLDQLGAPGDRWDGADPPTLERILFHLVQEYARHVGQLDIVVELAGGSTGE